MDILTALREEESRLEERIAAIKRAIIALNAFVGSSMGSPRKGRKSGWKMSAAAKAKIAKAARARWAKIKVAKK